MGEILGQPIATHDRLPVTRGVRVVRVVRVVFVGVTIINDCWPVLVPTLIPLLTPSNRMNDWSGTGAKLSEALAGLTRQSILARWGLGDVRTSAALHGPEVDWCSSIETEHRLSAPLVSCCLPAVCCTGHHTSDKQGRF